MTRLAKLLALLGLLVPAAGAEDRPSNHATVIARDHLLLLESWSRRANPDAARQLAVFEGSLLKIQRCRLELDAHVLEGVSQLGPEGLLPLTLFYLEVFVTHVTGGQPWLANLARTRTTAVLKRYRGRSTPPAEARRRHSQMLVAIAVRLSRHNYVRLIEIARDAALEAVSLTPQSYAALYWAAFLEEKLGRYDEALHLLTQLLQLHGDDPEIRLRHGINLARRGKAGAARADLERVARSADDDAWRILAYQELAQLDPKAGDPRAVAVLDEALAVFPNDPGLRLLASFHGRPVDPVPEGDVPPSPRLRYETVREAELVAADQALVAEVESRLAGLSSTLAEIRRRIESGETDERAFRFCRDVEPMPR